MSHCVLAFYCFTSFCEKGSIPNLVIASWKENLARMQARGRIYISSEGVNAQMSLESSQLEPFCQWLRSDERFANTEIKVHNYHEHAFEKLIIKYRPQLVAFDTPIDITQTAHHMSPSEWKKCLEKQDPHTVILDVRNQYEYDVGHFDGAIAPNCNTFRDYKKFTEHFCQERDPKTTRVLMYCTGGIRCEIYSAYLKEKGFENISQLQGGVIGYGLKEGSKHWKGKLFVFDDRMSVPLSDEPSEPIAKCRHCEASCDHIYNCANTDCNEMFVSCPACIEKTKGCCSSSCQASPRLRPLAHQNPHKPFRKWHTYSQVK